jgi:hypothetical protein
MSKPTPVGLGIVGLSPKKGEATGDIHALPKAPATQAPTETAPPPATPSPGLKRIEPRPEAAPRTGITIRMLNSDGERLRTLAFKTKRTKQDLLDLAIREFLDRNQPE